MPVKISLSDAVSHNRNGVVARYYQLPDVENGKTVAYAEFSGEHGERTIGEHVRIYYVLEGQGEFLVNGVKYPVDRGDLVTIPPHATYNLWPQGRTIKVLLYMELLDIAQLPK